MDSIKINLNNVTGKIKPMHSANNGPVFSLKDYKNGTMHPFGSNLDLYRAAGFPYARTHDTSFYHRYGLEHVIDVLYLFPDFDADVNDPASYDFTLTDEYVECTYIAGTKIYYRLGHRIEHNTKKYGVLPPRDFKKWAEICEHIIRHYTEGWADGYHYDMEYWEIWGEPDLAMNSIDNPCWIGTNEQFFEFYHITATHLKSCFPHLKIGGPSIAGNPHWADKFLSQLKAPLDFFSWHHYYSSQERFAQKCNFYRGLLDKYGFTKTESVLAEWNYLKDEKWENDNYVYCHRERRLIKGASFEAAALTTGQRMPIDIMMYYDVRPNEFWNGVFNDTVVGEVFKGYYPFVMFNELYKLGCEVESSSEGDLFVAGAKNDTEAAIMLTRYIEDNTAGAEEASIEITGLCEGGTIIEWYLLDKDHDLTLVNKAEVYGAKLVWQPSLNNYDCYLIKTRKK